VVSSPDLPEVNRKVRLLKGIDEMTSSTRNFVRFVAVPGIVVGAAMGLAAMANGSPTPAAPTTTAPAPVGPGYQYRPDTYATPAPTQAPGWQAHHGPGHRG
jgi:hypothetical protein